MRIGGPNVLLEPNTAQAIAVTLHELATNAAKYGALSVPDGHVHVEWSRGEDEPLVLRWTETGCVHLSILPRERVSERE